jgi:hypothetical protein
LKNRLESCSLVIGELKKKTRANRRAPQNRKQSLYFPPSMEPDSPPESPHSGAMSGQPYQFQSRAFSSSRQASAGPPIAEHDKRFTCDVADCSAGPYKRIGDLKRHNKKHGTQQVYDCSAVDCNRTGTRGFTRKDKLVDHMLAGHDEDEMFSCPKCGVKLSRDMFAMHDRMYHSTSALLGSYRTCPLPRCSFKVNVSSNSWIAKEKLTKLDMMQHHLLEKHDGKARAHYPNLMEQRGYDARTCEVVCPVCTSNRRFSGHKEFAEHFMQTHFHGPACEEHVNGSCSETCISRGPFWLLKQCTCVPVEVHQHRRTILRIWPGLGNYPVFEDIKCSKNSK